MIPYCKLGVGKHNKYSTNETVVGTWIDEKPIYRKVILCSRLEATELQLETGTIIGNIPNIDTLIKGDGMSQRFSGGFDTPIPYFQFNHLSDIPNQLTTWWRDRTTGDIYIRAQQNLTNITLILEYTKL